MPLFDFQCSQCQQVSELLVRGDAQPACPRCGNPRLDKLVARPAAPAKSRALVQAARTRAKAEGHFSNY